MPSLLEDAGVRPEQVLEAVDKGITVLDRAYRIVHQNQASRDVIGDHVGRICFVSIEGRESACEDCPVTECFRDGQVHTTLRRRQASAGAGHVLLTASPLRDEWGVVVASVKTIRDVSSQVRAEEDLLLQNRKLSTLYTIGNAVSQSLDIEENLRAAVEETRQALGLDAVGIYLAEPDGKTMLLRVHKGFTDDFAAGMRRIGADEGVTARAAAAKEPVVLQIDDYPTPRLLPLLLNHGFKTVASVPLISGGEVVGALNIAMKSPRTFTPEECELLSAVGHQLGVAVHNSLLFSKITEDMRCLVQAREEARESEARYRLLIESVTDYIFTVFLEDSRPAATRHGPGCVRITGYTPEEYAADLYLWFKMVYDDDRAAVVEQAVRVLAGEEVQPLEHRIIHKNGGLRWVKTTLVSRHDHMGRLVAYDGLISDITERRRLEDQLRHAQKMEALGLMAGGIAHDFNNILSAIIGYAELLGRRLGAGDALSSYLQEILAASRRATNLTQSLLAFSKKQVINPKPVMVDEIVAGLEKMLVRLIGEDVEMKTTLLGGDATIFADRGQLEQVLMNLVMNARDAMPGGGTIAIETGIVDLDRDFIAAHGYGEPGSHVLLSVSDTGSGMDEKTLDKIFEPFFTTKELGRGTGLGLAIVYGIVKQNNGYINVYSEVREGTTFRIYFPAVASPGQKPDEPAPAEVKRGTETILLVEDDEAVRKLIRAVLEEYGYRILEAVDGEDAVGRFMDAQDSVQLLLLDVVMPKKNGREVYEEITRHRPGIRAIFTSGYPADIITSRGMIDSGQVFISKPVSTRNLLMKVREVLDEKRP